MESEIEHITSWLTDGSSHSADILTILGVGGIGKTSLANYVYELHRHEYKSCSFVQDISRRHAENFHGLLDLQKQLYGDISKKNLTQLHDVSRYTSMICKALARVKVLLVLDDIDSLDQLDALLGNKGFHPGSKIIITTNDASLTERCALFSSQVQPKHRNLLLHGIYEPETLQLLCIHAFENQNPKQGYEEVSEELVKYCQGHPLALKVLGRSLRKRDVAYWEECIKGLKNEPLPDIRKAILRMSFHSLSSNNDKELFKHIACFFVGTDRDVSETILNACDINTISGITNLIDKCLLSITYGKLMMHQLVQEMGRYLVCQESPNKPWERSRLWCHVESFKVLKQKKAAENILGLALDMRMLEKEQLSGSLLLETDALSKMESLKLLQLNYVKMKGSYNNISKELRWLCMHGFPLKSIPSELLVENLVVLDMSHSNIESFDTSYTKSQRFVSKLKGLIGSNSNEKRLLGSLKILDLSFCEQLHSVCGFSEIPALEKLIISNCKSLIHVSESIEHCVELVFIDLSNCKKLERLPGKLKKIKTLLLNGCDNLVLPTEMRVVNSLQMVEANNININSQRPSSSASVEVIRRDLGSFISSLPTSLVHLSLGNNNLSNNSFPMDFSSLSMLKTLNLDGNPIVSMPSCVRNLHRLEHLSMRFCELLETVEHPPSSLRDLVIGIIGKLREIKFSPEMSPLYLGVIPAKNSSFLIEGIIEIQPLAHVEDKVLCSLGWVNLESIKYQYLTFFEESKYTRFIIQMYYEFGIFSTIYQGKEMPDWISCRSKGSLISLTIPTSPKELRGLNFCYVSDGPFKVPVIYISNLTKKHTWIYNRYIPGFDVAEERVIFLSHWMFGKNEMEAGDELIIVIANRDEHDDSSIRECGVGLVYDNGRMLEDALGYYKSWNHIIGGDLSPFQTITGEYILFHNYFMTGRIDVNSFLRPFSAESAHCKEERFRFRAFSQQKSDLVVRRRGGILETMQCRSDAVKMIESLRTKIAIVKFIYSMFKYSKVKTRSQLCFSLKLYTLSRFLPILYLLLVLVSYN